MAEILHSGFDGLTFTLTSIIPNGFAEKLAAANAYAKESHCNCILELGAIKLSVTTTGARGYTCHTGDHGAVWLIQDPTDPIPNNPMIKIDFRAMGLALHGLEGAERHFHDCMAAFDIPYVETQLRVSRVDFAVDVLAPWFEPDRHALVVPANTRVSEITGIEETETLASCSRVVGLRAGAIANRQLVIYDKRQEVIQKGKMGWLTIWNQARANAGQPELDLIDRAASQISRFEMRMESKQLRNRFEMQSWQDLRDTIGDTYRAFFEKIRYCEPSSDSNRARWPIHPIWQAVQKRVESGLLVYASRVIPSDVIYADKMQKWRELDARLLGLFVTRAALSDVNPEEFEVFMDRHVQALALISKEHDTRIGERFGKVLRRYRLG